MPFFLCGHPSPQSDAEAAVDVLDPVSVATGAHPRSRRGHSAHVADIGKKGAEALSLRASAREALAARIEYAGKESFTKLVISVRQPALVRDAITFLHYHRIGEVRLSHVVSHNMQLSPTN
jgi:hypothetical protein